MRIAVIYDIHGNLPALEAVLDNISTEQVDAIVVGGDVVAGPMPSETLSLLQDISISTYFIRGNAESELLRCLNGEEPGGLSERANAEASWVAKTLSPEHQQFISSWSTTLEMELEGWGKVLFCHATPHSDIEVFTRLTPEKKLVSTFENLGVSLVVCGHTHMQFERVIGGIGVINAGSVGMPFGKTGADWLVLEANIEFRHTDYDMTKAVGRIRQSKYPNAEDFAVNNILHPPSETEALEMLTQLEIKQAEKK